MHIFEPVTVMFCIDIKTFAIITYDKLKLAIQFIYGYFHGRTTGVFKYIINTFFKN